MAYAAVVLDFFDNKKYIAAVQEDARCIPLHFWALAHANEELTDGFVSEIQVRRRWELGDPKALADLLVCAGLWERVADGYQIHDFLEHNLSAEQVKAKRAATADRVNRWRQRHVANADVPAPSYISNSATPPASNGVTNGVSNSTSDSAYAIASRSSNVVLPPGAAPPLVACLDSFEAAAQRPLRSGEDISIADWLAGKIRPKGGNPYPPPRSLATFEWAVGLAVKQTNRDNCIPLAAKIQPDAPEHPPLPPPRVVTLQDSDDFVAELKRRGPMTHNGKRANDP